MLSHYDRLGVSADASYEEIRGAYRRRCQLLHPARHAAASPAVQAEAATALSELVAVWEVLRDPERRAS